MREVTIVEPTKTGSITLAQARKAVQAVMEARKSKRSPTQKQLEKARERYLGSFGAGPYKAAKKTNKIAGKKTTGQKTVSK